MFFLIFVVCAHVHTFTKTRMQQKISKFILSAKKESFLYLFKCSIHGFKIYTSIYNIGWQTIIGPPTHGRKNKTPTSSTLNCTSLLRS